MRSTEMLDRAFFNYPFMKMSLQVKTFQGSGEFHHRREGARHDLLVYPEV